MRKFIRRGPVASALILVSALTLSGTAVLAAGMWTNNVPLVGPCDTTTGSPNYSGGKFGCWSGLLGSEMLPMDTGAPSGAVPQSVAASAFQVAALSAGLAKNAATATSGAATLNAVHGTITSESLSTAAGASYTLTLTNSQVLAASVVQAAAYLGSSTGGGPLAVTSVTPAAGSVVIVVKNNGSTALNGTIVVPFQVNGR